MYNKKTLGKEIVDCHVPMQAVESLMYWNNGNSYLNYTVYRGFINRPRFENSIRVDISCGFSAHAGISVYKMLQNVWPLLLSVRANKGNKSRSGIS